LVSISYGLKNKFSRWLGLREVLLILMNCSSRALGTTRTYAVIVPFIFAVAGRSGYV